MKFNNKKPAFAFLTLLSSCAIALSAEIIPSKLLSKNESFEPAIKQQLNSQKGQNQNDRVGKENDGVVEEIELDKEWRNILGDDESLEEILLANSTV